MGVSKSGIPQTGVLLELVESGTVATVRPPWFLEVATGFLAAQRRRLITAAARRQVLEKLSAFDLIVDETDALGAFDRISVFAGQYGLLVYGAVDLEIALRRSLPLSTRDRALFAAAERCGVRVFH